LWRLDSRAGGVSKFLIFQVCERSAYIRRRWRFALWYARLVARRASRIATWSRIRFISSFKAYSICNTNVTFARMHHRIIFELYVDNECAYSILDYLQILTEILQRESCESSYLKFISNSATFVFPSETSSFNHWDFILNFIRLYIETKMENYLIFSSIFHRASSICLTLHYSRSLMSLHGMYFTLSNFTSQSFSLWFN